MGCFNIAFGITKPLEGFYSNVTGDYGGETYIGISRHWFPNWEGWKIIDTYEKEIGRKLAWNEEIKNDELDLLVEEFYINKIWNKINGNSLNYQRTVNLIFDWTVTNDNDGIIAIQRKLGLLADGILGRKTTLAINRTDNAELIKYLIDVRLNDMKQDVKRNPSQRKFEKGWEERINSFR